MATNYTVGIRFTGNASSLNQATQQAAAGEREVGRAGQQAGATASRGLQPVESALERISRTATATFGVLVGGAALMQVGSGVRRFADEYANIGAQMRQASDDTVSFGHAQDVAFGIAQRTSSALAGTADLASKLTRSLRGMGVEGAAAFERGAALTESIQQAIALSHVSADAGNAAVIQLTQGLGSGVLRGDELNSVLEQTPRLAQAIADGMGVTIGQLRAMGAEGLVTSQAVITALQGQSTVLRTEFADLPLTIERSWTMLRNAVERYVGQADQASGASRAIAAGIAEIAQHIDVLVVGLEAVGVATALNFGLKALSTIANYGKRISDLALAKVQAVNADRAAAASALSVAQARSVETAATLAAIEDTRALQVAKLQAAQTETVLAQRHLEAANAAGVLSFAQREQRLAADQLSAAQVRQSVATAELATLGRQQAAVQAELASAAAVQVAAQTRVATAMTLSGLAMSGVQRIGSSLLGLLGGWPGVVLAAAAAVVYLATRQNEAEKISAQLITTSNQLADAHGRVTQSAIDEAAAAMKSAQALRDKRQAELESARSSIQFSGNVDIAARAAVGAAADVDRLTSSITALDTARRTAIASKAFQDNLDQLAQGAKQEAQGFDQLRGALKEQNAELEKQIATYGKGKAAQLEYAQSLAIAAEQAKGDNNVTRARIASLQALYEPLIKNAAQLDAMTAANKRHTGSTKEATAAHQAAAEAARELARANTDIAQSQATLDEQNTQLREKLAGLSAQQIEYNTGVRDAVAAYQDWIRAGVPMTQAMDDLQAKYDQLNDRLQLKNQLDAQDVSNTPDKVRSYEVQTSAAERYYQVIEQGAKTAADTIANYFVRNVRSIGDLWHGLVDSAKSVVAQIISTWLQLRVLQPLLGSVFGGGGGGGWVGMATSLYGAASGGSSSGGGVGTAAGAVGAVTGSQDYANYIQNGVSAYKAYQWASTGGLWGSGGVGAGNVASVGVGANGQAVAFNPWASTPSTSAGYYGGSTSAAYGAVPYASIAGGVMGAYYGSKQGDGGWGTAASTVSYGALGAGVAGTAAGVAGGASLGAAATGAFGAAAAATSWIPIVGWIIAAAALVDHFSGGKVFGTKYATGQSNLNMGISADGAEASASLDQWKYHNTAKPNFMGALTGGWSEVFKFGDKDRRNVVQPVTHEMTAAAQMLYDNIEDTLVKGATKLGVDVPEMLTANILAQTKYNKKGKSQGTEYIVDYLGRTWKEATAELAAQRLGAEALVKVVQASAGSVAQTIAEQWRDSSDTLLDGAETMLAAQADINKGNSLVALGATATLSQVIKFVQGLQAEGEKLTDTYARIAQASAQYSQFVGQFKPQSSGFGESLQAINAQMLANIDQANALAQAAGMQHAAEADLANIHQAAAQQAADAITKLSAAASDLAGKLYPAVGGTLSAVMAQLDKLNAKVQTAAQLAIGDKSPLDDKAKLDIALKGLRSGITSADDVLALGRKLYASSADYTGLYNKVSEILQLPGATGQQSIDSALTDYNKLIGQRDQYQAQADATARFTDAKTLAQYVADISTTHGIGYSEAASGLGFSLQDLAKDLGLTNIKGYLDTLQQQDVGGTTVTASANIVDAIRGIGHDIVQAIIGGPLATPGKTTATPIANPTDEQLALLASLRDQLDIVIKHTGNTAATNSKMLANDNSGVLSRIATSMRGVQA